MDGSRGRINKSLNNCLYTLHPSQVKHGLTPDLLQLVHVVFYTIPFQPRFRPKSYWFAPNPCLWKLNTPLVLKRGRLMNYSRSGPIVIPTTSEFTYISIHIYICIHCMCIPTTIISLNTFIDEMIAVTMERSNSLVFHFTLCISDIWTGKWRYVSVIINNSSYTDKHVFFIITSLMYLKKNIYDNQEWSKL